MPASLFCRYLEFFDIESATPMQTWDGGTRRLYEAMTAGFRDRIHLKRRVCKVIRSAAGVTVEDESGAREAFDDVVFACNANQTLMILDRPTFLENWLLASVRYESELHNHTVVHSDAADSPTTRSRPWPPAATTSSSTAPAPTTTRSPTSCTTSSRGRTGRTGRAW